jgi:hypothetical protein
MTSNKIVCQVCESSLDVEEWLRHGCHGGVVLEVDDAWVDAALRKVRRSLLDDARIQNVAEDLGVSETDCRIPMAQLTQELAEATGR